MTCTIHYSFEMKAKQVTAVRNTLEQLRYRALELPFLSVSELLDVTAKDWETVCKDKYDPRRALAIRASLDPDNLDRFMSAPERTLGFVVNVGAGCESAVIGLRKWGRQGGVESGYDPECWGWHAFTKTYSALSVSDEHFIRCHLLLIRLLECVDDKGFLRTIKDEGGFWEVYDWEAMAERVGCERTDSLCQYAEVVKDLLWPDRMARVDQ